MTWSIHHKYFSWRNLMKKIIPFIFRIASIITLTISCNLIDSIFVSEQPTFISNTQTPGSNVTIPSVEESTQLPPAPTPRTDLPANPPLLPTRADAEHMEALHRSGQTFITWRERDDLSGESYRVYRSNAVITLDNLSQATLLYEVSEGSASFYANYYFDGVLPYRYTPRYVIEDFAPPIDEGTGILVWTLKSKDLRGQDAGAGFYAVTVLPTGGAEALETGYSLGPLEETAAEPLPVEIDFDAGDRGHVFIQYMDISEWNPTFHAPNETNFFYGLDSSEPKITGAIQYAYDYVVYEPECDTSSLLSAPVTLILHGWDGNNYPPMTQDPDPWEWCTYKVYPVDVTETWYFGFAMGHDYRNRSEPGAGAVIANYTEHRILRMIYDLIRRPIGLPVDINRIYVYGHSMGASGTLAFALRYPNVFAAAYASEPMTNYASSGDGGGMDWRGDVMMKWGSTTLNLPVQLTAPGFWGDHLQVYDGTGVWDWQNHQQNVHIRQADEIVPIGFAHGRSDMVIEWPTQGQPMYGAFNAGLRAWGGAITNDDHTWIGFQGLPPGLVGTHEYNPFNDFTVVRNETVPGLSNASTDSSLHPTHDSTYNNALSWSSSWNPWDGPPVDQPDLWQISLCSVDSSQYIYACGTGIEQTVNVTPRRIQNFLVVSGAEYYWENHSVLDGDIIESGTVTASDIGLITVKGFWVSPTGNRLMIKPVDK
jgi:pimeloyl-ACP methyl ester carboxylesterase